MSILLTIGIIAISVYAGLGILLFFVQGKMLYQPTRNIAYTPESLGLDYEDIYLQVPGGQTVNGWYVPALTGDGQWTVLFCHGNAGNISHRLETLKLIHDLGANCLIIDYQGYGLSSGKPSEKGTLDDIKAGWNWLITEKQLIPDEIIIFGRSLGGSIAAITALEVQPAAVILESTFTSFDDIGRHYYPWLPIQWFTRYNYNTLEATKKLKCPAFVAHSPEDDIVPYQFGQMLYEAAPQPKLFRELKGTHNEGISDFHQLYRQIWQGWIDWLNENAEQKIVDSA